MGRGVCGTVLGVKSLGAGARGSLTSPELGRNVQHPREPLQPKPPRQPGEPQSAQPPPGAPVFRAPEPASGGSRRAEPEAEPSPQVGALPRAERTVAVGERKPSSPAPPRKADRQIPLPEGRCKDPPPSPPSPRRQVQTPQRNDTQTRSPKTQTQGCPLPGVGHTDSPHTRMKQSLPQGQTHRTSSHTPGQTNRTFPQRTDHKPPPPTHTKN